ncbi:MAG: hypothetical protein ACOC22_02470 [bacterium]
MLIGFDVDDILLESFTGILNYCSEFLKIQIPKNPNNFSVLKSYLSGNLLNDVLHAVLNNDNYVFPCWNCVEFVKRYHSKFNEEIFFISNRPQNLQDSTHEFIKNYLNDIPFHVICTDNKVKEIKRINFDYFVEDRYLNAYNIAQSGVMTFLKEKPWNKGRKDHPYIIRFNNWKTIEEKFFF